MIRLKYIKPHGSFVPGDGDKRPLGTAKALCAGPRPVAVPADRDSAIKLGLPLGDQPLADLLDEVAAEQKVAEEAAQEAEEAEEAEEKPKAKDLRAPEDRAMRSPSLAKKLGATKDAKGE